MIAAIEAPRLVDLLLRDRTAMTARIKNDVELPHVMRTMIATIAIAMAIVGAALGSYRGGMQIAFAAVKLPLVLLGTAALSAPTLWAIGTALGRKSNIASDLALVMSALAFGALLLAACTPLIVLGRTMELEYHRMILLVVAMFGIAGLASLQMIVRALAAEAAPGWRTSMAGLCIVFVLVGGQLAWALRPYLERPRTPEIVFVRELEGSLVDAISQAFDSARGEYTRQRAPLGDEP